MQKEPGVLPLLLHLHEAPEAMNIQVKGEVACVRWKVFALG